MYNNSNTTMQNYASEVDSASSVFKTGQNCVPLMLAHLNRYGEDLKIWGMPARIITFLAILDDIDIVSTRVNFKFRDETGTIKGTKWLESEVYEANVKVNSYVRVYGTMRRGQDENYVLINSIQPMEHLNELCAHLMEVTYMCLEAEDWPNQSPQKRLSTDNTTSANYNSFSAHSTDNNANGTLTKDQILIMDIIARGHPEDGAERSVIKGQVPANLVPQVDKILEFLSSEGHIYTTKTDDHFKKL